MEFTENQHQPFKRISRLGVVTLLHVALLVVVLNDMKIRISNPDKGPLIVTEVDKPKPPEPEKLKEINTDLPPPRNPVFVPKDEVRPNKTSDDSVIAKVTDHPEGKTTKGGSDTGGNEGGNGAVAALQVKAPLHVAAVIDVNACDKPTYPASSIRNGESGTVTLSMLVGTDGRVVETRTDTSSGYRALDRAASQALSLCRFKPGTIDGVPQQSWTKVQYVWKMD